MAKRILSATKRAIPRPFSFEWGKGRVIEEASIRVQMQHQKILPLCRKIVFKCDMIWERRSYLQLSELYPDRSASSGERAKSSRKPQSESRCRIIAGSLRSSFSGSTTVLRRYGSAYSTENNSLECPFLSAQTSSQCSSRKPPSILESGRS